MINLFMRKWRFIISGVRKNEPLFVKYDYKLKIIEILCTVIQVYSLHFYVISKNLVARYVGIAEIKMMFQKI